MTEQWSKKMSNQVNAGWIVTPVVPNANFTDSFLVFTDEHAAFWKSQHGFEVVEVYVKPEDTSDEFYNKMHACRISGRQ